MYHYRQPHRRARSGQIYGLRVSRQVGHVTRAVVAIIATLCMSGPGPQPLQAVKIVAATAVPRDRVTALGGPPARPEALRDQSRTKPTGRGEFGDNRPLHGDLAHIP